MPYFKTDLFYQQFNKSWSETWYISGSTVSTVASLFNNTSLLPFVNMRHTSVILYKMRISSVDNNRLSTLLYFNLASPLPISDAGGPGVTGVAAQLNFSAPTVGVSRKLELRGLRGPSISRNAGSGIPMPSAFLTSCINEYISNIVNMGFMVRAKTQIAVPPIFPNSKNALTAISAAQNGGAATITFEGGGTFTNGSTVSINRVDQKLYPGLKGLFLVRDAIGGSITIDWNSTQALGATPLSGYVRGIAYQYGVPIRVGSGFVNFVTRDTGKNSTGGRGARPAQRLRLAR